MDGPPFMQRTAVELLGDAWKHIDQRKCEIEFVSPAGREYALAMTAVEEAIGRVNRAESLRDGLRTTGQFDDVEQGDRTAWVPRDPVKPT